MRRRSGRRASPIVSWLIALVIASVAVAGAYFASVWSTQRPQVGGIGPRSHAVSRAEPVASRAAPTPVMREPVRTAASSPPNPTPTDHRLSITLPWRGGVEPTPTPTLLQFEKRQTPTPKPTPRPTTPVSHCVEASSSTSISPAAPGLVLVEVTARNYCGRVLAPVDVWFRVTGYRHGAVVHTVMGHSFDPIAVGDRAVTVIGLPGSIDWYDRIDVQVLGSGT